jgi:hypothetical protein
MPKILQDSQVIYVEPNAVAGEDDFFAMGDGAMKAPANEDYCIIVDLDVEVKGRTFSSTMNNGKDTIRMEYTSSVSGGQKIKFMEGSKIYLDKEQTKYITSLTTNYTDIHLKDIENGGTCEMFGIKSVDINYNNYMVPDVTIQFTDVRGVSLFAQEEMRHNVVQNGITASVNNDIEGSFFKCFFTFPYPKFTLRVKGFYGQMVSYELTCSDWRASFDSNSGSYNVTAKFIGYAFSFLTDLMANAVIAAPYSEYLGKDYWDANNGSRFYVLDKNGIKVPMKTLGEICKEFNTIKETVEKKMEEGNIDDLNLDAETKKMLVSPGLSEVKEAYDTFISETRKLRELIAPGGSNENFSQRGNTGRDTYAKVEGGNSFVLVIDNFNDDAYSGITNQIKVCEEKLKRVNSLYLKAVNDGASVLEGWTNKYGELKLNYLSDCNTWFWDKDIDNVLEEKTDEDFKALLSKLWEENRSAWENNINSRVYYYEDHGFAKIFSVGSGEETAEAQQLKQQIGDRMMVEGFAQAFNFPPTVENITRIFMAHVETFVQMVSDCASAAIANGQSRTLERLGLSLDNFTDLNSDFTQSNVIPPFPLVTKDVDLEGTTKREDSWIGEFGDENQFEEVRLIKGLLKGIENVTKDINFACANQTEGSNGEGGSTRCPMPNPLTYMDMFMQEGDNPFGKMNMNEPLEALGSLCARMYALVFCGLENGQLAEAGTLDAENFAYYFGKDVSIGTFKNFFVNKTPQDLLRYLKEGFAGKKTPWPVYNKKKGLLIQGKGGLNYMQISNINNGGNYVIPVKNWTWNEFNSVTKNNQYNKTKGSDGHYVSLTVGITNNGQVTDNTTTCIIYDKDLNYLKDSVSTMPDSNIKGELGKVCNDNFKDVIGVEYGDKNDLIHVKNKDTGVHESFNAQYSSNGEFIPDSVHVMDLYSVFGDADYYKQADTKAKAKYFLRKLLNLTKGAGAKKDFEGRTKVLLEKWFGCKVHNPIIEKANKLTVLACGAKVQGSNLFNFDDGRAMRWTTRVKLANYFNNWVETEFVKIANLYELRPKKGTIADAIKNGSFEESSFNKVYIKDNKGIRCKQCDENTAYMKSLYRAVVIGSLTCSNYYKQSDMRDKEDSAQIALSDTDIQSYLTTFLSAIKEKLNIQEGVYEGGGQSATMTLNLGYDSESDDIRIGVYRYMKLLYDKWIASDPNNSFLKMEYMFSEERPTFYFVDSCYNRIGKTMYINISKLVKQIINSQTNRGLPLISMMSGMYADNHFSLMFIQNFADRAESGFMKEMFTPIPYIEAKEPDNHPEYVVLYPYEPSSKLDVKGGDYPDDGFYLNDSTTWPIMVSSKRPGVDLSIPAFGVTYGQQYQSYFKDIQVDMNSPMSTEQSITAKFLIAGANTTEKNTGPRQVTAGQDLYTIYANNSYTCTVTMMGCAWVQPMMYFVLNNIPMFRGSYQIVKVNHSIQAGQFMTTFTGVRMARTATRAVRDFLIGNTIDSTAEYQSQEEIFNHANANIGNDCEYAYYSPVPVDGQDFSSELSEKLYDNLSNLGKAYLDGSGSVFKSWTIEDALAAIAWQEFGGHTDTAKANRAAVIACMYNKRGCNGKKGYKVGIFSQGWNYFVAPSKYDMPNRLLNVYNNAKAMEDARAMVKDIWAGGPYHYLVGRKNTWDGQQVTTEQVQKGFTTRGSSDKPSTLKTMSSWGNTLYSLEKYGSLYHIVGGLNEPRYVNGFVPQPQPKGRDEDTAYKENLARSVQQSLNATQYYTNVTVEHTIGKNVWVRLVGKGNNSTNAIFDCMIQTYGDWFENIYWDKGNGNMNNDAVAVCIRMCKTPPKKQTMALCSNFDVNGTKYYPEAINITDLDKDINPSLKLALIKFFKKKGYTKAEQVKSCFTSLAKFTDDNKIVKFFELDKSREEDSVQDCNSLAGFPSGAMDGGELDGADSSKAQSRDKAVISRKIQQLFGSDSKPSTEGQALAYIDKFSVTTIGTDGKNRIIPVELHRKLKPSFIAIMNELKQNGFKVDSINSYKWRPVPGTCNASNHSYGVAVDINPGKAGNPWFDTHIAKGVKVVEGTKPNWKVKMCPYGGVYDKLRCIWDWENIAVKTFAKHGWGWGGDYGDTMHFSYLGGK